jgi:hypothetical protein
VGSKVDREKFGDLDAALARLELRAAELQREAPRKADDTILGRRFEPVQQVFARLELRSGRTRAGVDVRGDGSPEAYTGWVRRRVVEQRAEESAYDALRRALATR